MTKKYPSDVADRTLVRFPAGMKPQLMKRAKAGYRSLNAEIVATLQKDLDREAASGQA